MRLLPLSLLYPARHTGRLPRPAHKPTATLRPVKKRSSTVHRTLARAFPSRWQTARALPAAIWSSPQAALLTRRPGSDGTLLDVLALAPPAGLGIPIVPPRPALTPIFIENYPFADLAGISLRDIELKIFSKPQENLCGEQTRSMTEEAAPMFSKKNKKQTKPQSAVGDLLLTHKNLSGPVILNHGARNFRGNKACNQLCFPLYCRYCDFSSKSGFFRLSKHDFRLYRGTISFAKTIRSKNLTLDFLDR